MIFKVFKGTVNGILSDLQLQSCMSDSQRYPINPYKPGSENNKEDVVVFNLEKVVESDNFSFFLSAIHEIRKRIPNWKKSFFG